MRFLNPLPRCVCSHLLCSLRRLSWSLVLRPQLSSQQCKWRLARMSTSSVQASSRGPKVQGQRDSVLHTQRALVHLPPSLMGLNSRVGSFCVQETEAMGGAGWRMNVQALFLQIYAPIVTAVLNTYVNYWTLTNLHWSHLVMSLQQIGRTCHPATSNAI